MGLKIATSFFVGIICVFFINNSLAQNNSKTTTLIWLDKTNNELKIEHTVDTVSIEIINYFKVFNFDEFTQEEIRIRKLKIEEEEKLGNVTIYNTNDLFNILLVEKLNNETVIIHKGKYLEILE
eukprot:TRINITY_DN1107_c0_g2_i1.p3 TRINITY_DN1107_c0_g2~~TRINITY_DN1107_c0_g2_i1.p3  ORF type:complete len:124 (+),score=10.28 TRINITY_DN1107_c0_g2_i1:646-1017(+)